MGGFSSSSGWPPPLVPETMIDVMQTHVCLVKLHKAIKYWIFTCPMVLRNYGSSLWVRWKRFSNRLRSRWQSHQWDGTWARRIVSDPFWVRPHQASAHQRCSPSAMKAFLNDADRLFGSLPQTLWCNKYRGHGGFSLWAKKREALIKNSL